MLAVLTQLSFSRYFLPLDAPNTTFVFYFLPFWSFFLILLPTPPLKSILRTLSLVFLNSTLGNLIAATVNPMASTTIHVLMIMKFSL